MMIFLFTFALVLAAFADPDVCQDVTMDMPLTKVYYYPANWNDTGKSPPHIAASQKCTFKFTIPNGMYADLLITNDDTNSVMITDSRGVARPGTSIYTDRYFFIAPGFSVTVQTNTKPVLFGIQVNWRPYPNFAPKQFSIHPNTVPTILVGNDTQTGAVITAESQVSLLTTVAFANDVNSFLRLTQIFDGSDTNAPFLGNLLDLLASNNQLVSTGKTLTLFSLIPAFIGNQMIVQDYFNVKQFKTYTTINCLDQVTCNAALDATNGPAAAVRVYPHYLNYLSMGSNSTVTVYQGSIMDAHAIIIYDKNSAAVSTPQKFTSSLTTYAMDNGQASFVVSQYDTKKWGVATDKRQGFFVSPNFGELSVNQGLNELIQGEGNDVYNITYQVKVSGLMDGATLRLQVFNGNNAVLDQVYTKDQLPGNDVKTIVGQNFNVIYDNKGSATNGLQMSFKYDKTSSTNCISVMLIFVISLVLRL